MDFANLGMKVEDEGVNIDLKLYMIYPVRGYRLPNNNPERSSVKPSNHILRITRLSAFCLVQLSSSTTVDEVHNRDRGLTEGE